jgi:cytoskeletal protein CcmA (bactofilin family)
MNMTIRRWKMGKKSRLLQGEGGQVLILTVIVMMLAALIIPPILGLTYSSAQTTNIRKERMQVLYAADTGIQVALYKLDNLGNGTHPDVPDDIGTYRNFALTVEQSGLPVNVGVKIYKDGNDTYTITSTASNWDNRKVTVQARVHLSTVQKTVGPVYKPGEGNVSTSPFEYALAVLGDQGLLVNKKAAVISGDVFSNGPVDLYENSKIQPDPYGHAGNLWAKGSVILRSGVSISGSVHAEGDIILYDGAFIGGSAYATGSIYLNGTAKIQGGAGAYGSINVTTVYDKKAVFGSGIGNSSVAYGDIRVSGPASSWGFNVGGDVASNQNIIVDNNGVVIGDASAAGTVTVASGGVVQGDITSGAPEFTLILDEVPTLVSNDPYYWQQLYKDEAMYGPGSQHIESVAGPPPIVYNNVDLYWGNTYVKDDLELKNKVNLYVMGNTTVYVEGSLWVKSGCNIIGNGKVVVRDNIYLYNNVLGAPDSMPLLMACCPSGTINVQNWADLWAVLYAPCGGITLQNGAGVVGSLVAQGLESMKEFNPTWVEEVRDIPGLPGGNVTGTEGSWVPVEQPPVIEYKGVVIDYYIVCENEDCT